ncbi:MAG: 2-oxo acid dehydrogenase subunit E2 [Ignavibacteriales bacterium]|nr:2-oxo acid dehydrogenase subunit E2 [Ignavibacteriales bacterium]
MAKVEIPMPQLGESLTEGTIIKWHKKAGDSIKKDETLLEISTDKVDSEIPSPVSGIVTKLLFEEGKVVLIKTTIAIIETDTASAVVEETPKAETKVVETKPTPPPAKVEAQKPAQVVSVPQVQKVVEQKMDGQRPDVSGRFYSPLVLNIARTEGISMSELERIPGTGQEGRVSKKDILAYVANRKSGGFTTTTISYSELGKVATPISPRIESSLKHIDSGELAQKYPAPQYEILQMSNVIQKMAEHMVRSVATSPHVFAVHTCDFTNLVKFRESNGKAFEQREGFKLTYTPFIADAIVKALKEFPLVNSSIEGDKIILKKFVNLGMAVASDNGLIVPVIKNADEKNFLGLARQINDLATRTRNKKLTLNDIEGGTFTFSNYGVFGTLLGTPIIAQPQVAIMGVGAIKKQPVVLNDAIAIRSISYFTLSFDHRIIDGALGGQFLEAVIRNIENFDVKAIV